MSPTFQIAWRFLTAKKRSMLLSLAGIACGMALFIVTQAQASGFQGFFVETILGINGAIRVEDKYLDRIESLPLEGDGRTTQQVPLREARHSLSGVPQPRLVQQALSQFREVTAVAQVVRGPVTASNGFTQTDARVFGIDLNDYIGVSALPQQIQFGRLEHFHQWPQAVILGSLLAQRMQVAPGDTVFLRGSQERRRYRVAAIIETGVELYDKTTAFVPMREARMLLGRPDGASYLQVGLRDPDAAPRLARHMESALGHYVASWQHRERSWLEVFSLLKITSAASSSMLLIIAALGIFNTLAIIVMERQREIAILRAVGFTRFDILRIFLNLGVILLITGTLAGWLMAALLTFITERLPIRIRGIFTTDHILVDWSLSHYLLAALVAALVVLAASLLPARRASRIEPGAIIRSTSG